MTRPSTPPILSEIRSASSPASQVSALRALKNEIIGHDQKKEMWIGLGVLAPLARILNTHKGSGKRKHRDSSYNREHSKQRGARSDEEDARLQATIIVGSLALGGPAFVPPIYASHVVSPLLSSLSPTESSPQLVLAALRSLNALADSLLLSHPDRDSSGDGCLSLLYTEQHLSTLTQILLQDTSPSVTRQQVALVAELISKTCHDEQRHEHHRALLAQAGVLEALAVKVHNYLVFIVGYTSSQNVYAGVPGGPLSPTKRASWRSTISSVFRAVSAIIRHSRARAAQFLAAPAFSSIFRRPDPVIALIDSKAILWAPDASNTFTAQRGPPYVIDRFLPRLPSSHRRDPYSPSSNFPPLAALGSSGKHGPHPFQSFSTAVEINQSQGLEYIEEEESSLLSWLLYIARAEDEVTGLSAAVVLAIIYQLGLAKRGKASALALLLVPTLSRMLDKDVKISPDALDACENLLVPPERFIKQQAPLALAILAEKSPEIQRAAVEAGVIKKLSQLLKETYDEVPSASTDLMWSPESSSTSQPDAPDEASRLGPRGLSPVASHVMKVREGVLGAIAAIASDKEDYRKDVVDQGVIPFVIKTLTPNDIGTSSISADSRVDKHTLSGSKAPVGNPKYTVLAACGAAKALTRSVGTLRTSLMDSGLTAPILILLKHQDISLQIAASAVVCNMCLKFSPMRQAMLNAGALKIVCEQAHSMNSNLRFNSIWVIKNFVLEAPNDLKMKCLEELGPGWLKQIICADVDSYNYNAHSRGDREEGSATPIRMSTPNAAGERVDLLNAVQENSPESSQDGDDAEGDSKMDDSIGALSRADIYRKSYASVPQLTGRGSLLDSPRLPSNGTDLRSSSLNEEQSIQVQGLSMLQNLIIGDGNAAMIDFVFQDIGQDKLFETLTSKLRSKVFNAFNRERRSSENGVRNVQPHTEVVRATTYIIVHIAAGSSRQRQLLVAQDTLLKLILPLLNHADFHIRVNCVWMCLNLTWLDDASDNVNCKARARVLANLGFFEKLEQMDNDPELDIRERAKTAVHQMSSLLRH